MLLKLYFISTFLLNSGIVLILRIGIPFTTAFVLPVTKTNDVPRIHTRELKAGELTPEQELTLANIPEKYTPLFTQALKTTVPKAADTTKNAHDPFRFEWGTWIDDDAMVELMERVDEVRAAEGAFEKLFPDWDGDISKGRPTPRMCKIASGEKWDCCIHALPSDMQHAGRWPTGSWTILKALTGVVEVAMLREDRDGNVKKRTKKDLRGGSDSSFGIGGGGEIGGADCIKYVGGPLRSYMGKSKRALLLELVIRPPISVEDENHIIEEWELENIDEIIDIVVSEPKTEDNDDGAEDSSGSFVEEYKPAQPNLRSKLGMKFEKVGGLDAQLDTIVRRVLASRANPEAARRLGILHVRGILLSGPPGCGKTLLARELARLLGAREPQIVNGPEILDKFIGEAEKRVRDLFVPAELEYASVGDDSALHIIILDEMDAIARKRGSASSDATGVRDSVVNQLLSKMDGVKEANNVLVVGLTNRPELLDPALLRPGRLEVQLKVELPDASGRRDIFRIHTRQMKEAGGLSKEAETMIEDLSSKGLAGKSDKFTGAEIAGLVRSAASFALARSIEKLNDEESGESFLDNEEGRVSVNDFDTALSEVRPALGKQDSLLKLRFPGGISPCSQSIERIMRDLRRFTAPVDTPIVRLHSLLLVGAGGNGGAGVTALGAWAGAEASLDDSADYVRFITSLDLLTGEGSGGDEARAAVLIDRFSEAREMPNSLLVLDDIDQLCAGSGPGGYSSVMISTLRALLRTPPESSAVAKAGGQSTSNRKAGRSMHIIATTSRSDAACVTLHELFEETLVVPLLTEISSVEKLLSDSGYEKEALDMAKLITDKFESIGIKSVLRLAERASATAQMITQIDGSGITGESRNNALKDILDDFSGDEAVASSLCEIL